MRQPNTSIHVEFPRFILGLTQNFLQKKKRGTGNRERKTSCFSCATRLEKLRHYFNPTSKSMSFPIPSEFMDFVDRRSQHKMDLPLVHPTIAGNWVQ